MQNWLKKHERRYCPHLKPVIRGPDPKEARSELKFESETRFFGPNSKHLKTLLTSNQLFKFALRPKLIGVHSTAEIRRSTDARENGKKSAVHSNRL